MYKYFFAILLIITHPGCATDRNDTPKVDQKDKYEKKTEKKNAEDERKTSQPVTLPPRGESSEVQRIDANLETCVLAVECPDFSAELDPVETISRRLETIDPTFEVLDFTITRGQGSDDGGDGFGYTDLSFSYQSEKSTRLKLQRYNCYECSDALPFSQEEVAELHAVLTQAPGFQVFYLMSFQYHLSFLMAESSERTWQFALPETEYATKDACVADSPSQTETTIGTLCVKTKYGDARDHFRMVIVKLN